MESESYKMPYEMTTRTVEDMLREYQRQQIALDNCKDELEQVKLALKQTREKLENLYENAPVAYLKLNEKGMISDINLTGAKYFGLSKDNLLHKHLSRFVAAESRNGWLQFLAEAQTTQVKTNCEIVLSKHDGAFFHAHIESTLEITDSNETIINLVLTDISKLRQAEFSLHDQESFFRLISDNSDEFITVLDLRGRRLFNSQSQSKLFENIDALIGMEFSSEILSEDRQYFQQVFNETVQTGGNMKADFRVVTSTGDIRYLESRGTLVKNSNGIALRVVIVSRDVTERVNAAKEISSLTLYDPLTGKSNRRLLHDRLNYVLTANKRKGKYAALLLVHLENRVLFFEPINKAKADLVLVEASSRISHCVRETDTVSRLGGQEFVVLLSELSTDQNKSNTEALTVMDKVKIALGKPYLISNLREENAMNNSDHYCIAKIGVFLFGSNDKSADQIMSSAEMELSQLRD